LHDFVDSILFLWPQIFNSISRNWTFHSIKPLIFDLEIIKQNQQVPEIEHFKWSSFPRSISCVSGIMPLLSGSWQSFTFNEWTSSLWVSGMSRSCQNFRGFTPLVQKLNVSMLTTFYALCAAIKIKQSRKCPG
jgi:hypothetical protein